MRNPERIDNILVLLRVIWAENPDQRFLQLITNILQDNGTIKTKAFGRVSPDMFFIEDDEVLEALQVYGTK